MYVFIYVCIHVEKIRYRAPSRAASVPSVILFSCFLDLQVFVSRLGPSPLSASSPPPPYATQRTWKKLGGNEGMKLQRTIAQCNDDTWTRERGRMENRIPWRCREETVWGWNGGEKSIKLSTMINITPFHTFYHMLPCRSFAVCHFHAISVVFYFCHRCHFCHRSVMSWDKLAMLLITSAGNETAHEFLCKQNVEGCLLLSRFLSGARTCTLPDKLLLCQVIDDIKTLSSKLTIAFLWIALLSDTGTLHSVAKLVILTNVASPVGILYCFFTV